MEITISWSFSYNTFVKFHSKTIGSHMTVLYPNPCYNEVCYKGTYFTMFFIIMTSWFAKE